MVLFRILLYINTARSSMRNCTSYINSTHSYVYINTIVLGMSMRYSRQHLIELKNLMLFVHKFWWLHKVGEQFGVVFVEYLEDKRQLLSSITWNRFLSWQLLSCFKQDKFTKQQINVVNSHRYSSTYKIINFRYFVHNAKHCR